MSSAHVRIVIVTPALAATNNGNWRTARRWQEFLARDYSTRLVQTWPDREASRDTVMIALHARRSAPSIAAWRQARGSSSLAVVLTGTDLYRDIDGDSSAQHSLAVAGALVTLQERGPDAVPERYRAKTRVIFQSASPRLTLPKTARHLRAVMVGHLREEKSPRTLYAAARTISPREGILLDHIGGAMDKSLADAAQSTMDALPHYRWLRDRPHEETRRRIQRAHLLIQCSQIEGGAHTIIEAATSGTPVLASRIDGNVGLLGLDYDGHFSWNDAGALVRLLRLCRAAQAQPGGLLQQLTAQIEARSPLFSPRAEHAAVSHLVTDLLPPRVSP